ncbi:MAG: FecR domain-containing protein [bacterium]
MPSFHRAPTDAELAQYLTRDCSGPEMHRIDEWLNEDPSHRARLDSLRLLWDTPVATTEVDVDALWLRVRTRTSRVAPKLSPASLPVPLRRLNDYSVSTRFLSSIAAVIVVAVSVALVMERQQAQHASQVAASTREYSTARGEHATVLLQDGSRITLAPLSRVKILPGFGVASRELALEGEAIVDVVHDARRPFRVHAGSAVAEDIGTRFDIRGYADEAAVTVAVAEGAVSLGRRADSLFADSGHSAEGVLIRKGAVGRLDGQGHITSREDVRINEYFGWVDGTLAFDDAPMDEVRRSLERWYRISITVDDTALRARRITARFDGQPVRAIIDALATTLDAKVAWSGTVATLTPR